MRVKLEVEIDLDPVPGAFHDPEYVRNYVQGTLDRNVGHYNPVVDFVSVDDPYQCGVCGSSKYNHVCNGYAQHVELVKEADPDFFALLSCSYCGSLDCEHSPGYWPMGPLCDASCAASLDSGDHWCKPTAVDPMYMFAVILNNLFEEIAANWSTTNIKLTTQQVFSFANSNAMGLRNLGIRGSFCPAYINVEGVANGWSF